MVVRAIGVVDQRIGSATRNDAVRLAFSRLTDKVIRDRLRTEKPNLFRYAKRGNKESQQRRADRIKKAMSEARKQDRRSFKTFRKTSSDMIERQYGPESKLAEQFLGHTEKATKRFYVDQHFDRLFEALAWLETCFDLASLET